jgi:hypothetical protein
MKMNPIQPELELRAGIATMLFAAAMNVVERDWWGLP